MTPLVFVGHWAFDGISFAVNTPVSHIICCGFDTGEQARENMGITLHSLEAKVGYRECWTGMHLDWSVRELWHALPETMKPNVASFSTSVELEKHRDAGYIARLFSNPQRLKSVCDNKMFSKRIFRQLGLEQPEIWRFPLSKRNLDKARQLLGFPCVIRKKLSFMGNGVYPLFSEEDSYEQLIAFGFNEGEMIVAERFIHGIPLNCNAVVMADGNVVSYPVSVQLIGLKGYTPLPFGFCGSDFVQARQLPSYVQLECLRQTQALGKKLFQFGYRGLFGVDFIYTEDSKVVPCEINPRMQTSTSMLNWTYKGTSNAPALLHIKAFGYEAKRTQEPEQEEFYSQIIMHVLSEEAEGIVKGKLKEGIYRFNQGKGTFDYVKPSLSPAELKCDEILLAGSPPPAGHALKVGSPLYKILLKQSVTEDGVSLRNNAFHKALASLKDKLAIKMLHDQ